MIQFIKNQLFYYRYKRAVKKANQIKYLTGKPCLVIMWKGRPVPVTKQTIKEWIHQRKIKKGITISQIEKGALYVTNG